MVLNTKVPKGWNGDSVLLEELCCSLVGRACLYPSQQFPPSLCPIFCEVDPRTMNGKSEGKSPPSRGSTIRETPGDQEVFGDDRPLLPRCAPHPALSSLMGNRVWRSNFGWVAFLTREPGGSPRSQPQPSPLSSVAECDSPPSWPHFLKTSLIFRNLLKDRFAWRERCFSFYVWQCRTRGLL